MIVRSLQYTDIEQCKFLWKDRFHDSDSFLDFYYSNYFNPAFSFGVFNESKLLSAAYGRDYFLRFGKNIYQGIMIGGVATGKKFEGNHYSNETISKIIEAAKHEEYSFACLSPVSEKIYSGLGFQTVSCCVSYAVENGKHAYKTTETAYPDVDGLLEIYNAFGKQFYVYPERSEYIMKLKVDEFLSDGDILYTYRNKAYAFYSEKNHACEEIAGIDENSVRKLMDKLPDGCKIKLPPSYLPFQKENSNLMLYRINPDITFDTNPVYCMDEF